MATITLTNKEAKDLANKVIPKVEKIREAMVEGIKKTFEDDLRIYKKFNWKKFRFETHRRTDEEVREEHRRKMKMKINSIHDNDYLYSWKYRSRIADAKEEFESEFNLCRSILNTKDHHQIEMDVNMYGNLQYLSEYVLEKKKKSIL